MDSIGVSAIRDVFSCPGHGHGLCSDAGAQHESVDRGTRKWGFLATAAKASRNSRSSLAQIGWCLNVIGGLHMHNAYIYICANICYVYT